MDSLGFVAVRRISELFVAQFIFFPLFSIGINKTLPIYYNYPNIIYIYEASPVSRNRS
jgi:hypothetical protein